MTAALRRHPAALTSLTVALLLSHLIMVGLHLIDRAVPAADPAGAPDWVHAVVLSADDHFWVVLHGAAAAALIVTLAAARFRALAAFWSRTVWGAWCVLALLWSLWTSPPASLTAPLVILVLAVPMARAIAQAWTEKEPLGKAD